VKAGKSQSSEKGSKPPLPNSFQHLWVEWPRKPDSTIHHFHQLLRNSKTNTGNILGSTFDTLKWFKNPLILTRVNSNAVINNSEPEAAISSMNF
jgi:hypothetical protein